MIKKILLLIVIAIVYITAFIVVWDSDWRGQNGWFEKILKIIVFLIIGSVIYTVAKYQLFKTKK